MQRATGYAAPFPPALGIPQMALNVSLVTDVTGNASRPCLGLNACSPPATPPHCSLVRWLARLGLSDPAAPGEQTEQGHPLVSDLKPFTIYRLV